MSDKPTIHDVLDELSTAQWKAKNGKPGDRSELDRRWAIFITKLEDAACWGLYIANDPQPGSAE